MNIFFSNQRKYSSARNEENYKKKEKEFVQNLHID